MKTKPSSGVSVILRGGLGNQLFGWATGFATSQRSGLELHLNYRPTPSSPTGVAARALELACFTNLPGLKSSFNSRGPFLSKDIRFKASQVIREISGSFDDRVIHVPEGTVLDGYFQNPKYFADFAERIREILGTSFKPESNIQRLSQSFGSDWIAVHVRRGDYKNFESIYELPGEEYYSRALETVKRRSRNTKVVVFSDEPDTARALVPAAAEYLGPQDLKAPGDNLMLMAMAPSLIGANSSFSWWAAFLNKNREREVFFPNSWMKGVELISEDVMMPGWRTVEAT